MVTMRKILKHALRDTLKVVLPFAYRMFYWARPRRNDADPRNPRRILILNGAHIGDIVISTSLLPVLRSAYPKAQIGFLVGSWSKMVVENHPFVDYVHVIDHWWHNRSRVGCGTKLRQFYTSRRGALREIRQMRYDIAICIYPYLLPDLMNFAWIAGIPIRLGFRRSMFASLATAAVNVPDNPFLHQGAIMAEVLKPLSLDATHLERRKAQLAENGDRSIREVKALLGMEHMNDATYQVIHMGSGALNRELPIAFWREIARELSHSSTLVFTGKGDREARNAASVIDGLDRCVNACGALSWDGFVAAIRHARMLYGVESMAGHVAAAVGTPFVVAYTGMAGVARWRPESELGTVLSLHLNCAPCQRMNGCKEMPCLRKITPGDVLAFSWPIEKYELSVMAPNERQISNCCVPSCEDL